MVGLLSLNNLKHNQGNKRLAVAGALLAIWAVGYTWGTWRYFTSVAPGGNDFLARYTAFGAYLHDDINPYSAQATDITNQVIYGRSARPGEDENRLTYPFYSILLYGPFVAIRDYSVSRAIHMTLLQVALFLGMWLTLEVLRWRPRPWLLVALMAWSLLNYSEARDVILGQFALFGFLSLAGTLYLLARGRDAAAGALFVLSTIKPTLVFLVIPFLLVWALSRRRWRFIGGFLALLVVLTLGGLLLLPSWIGDLLNNILAYPNYTVGQNPIWLLTHVAVPSLGQAGEWIISAALVAVMLWSWWRATRPGQTGDAVFHWALGITLVVSNLIVSRSATTNYVLLLVPTLWVFAGLDRHGRPGRVLIAAILLVSFVGLWWLHFATVVVNQEQPVMFLPWPLALGGVLLLCAPWLWRETRRAGWWPLSAPLPALAPAPEGSRPV
jgi:Glycosyltransferase family 87